MSKDTQPQTPSLNKGVNLAKVQGAFALPFAEQIAFFQQKVRLPTQSYKDLHAHQHDKAFVVAGAMKADLLSDLHGAVGNAIEDGESFGQFRKRFDEIVKQRGWTNWTGSDSKEGTAWRTKIIYTTNMRTSHSAGRYKQMTTDEMLKARPYWQYKHTSKENARLRHKANNNKVYAANDSWWSINYPQNGYGCNCYVCALSSADIERLGLSVSDVPSYDIASKGFAHASGSTWYPNLDKYPFAVAKALVASNLADGVFSRWVGRMENQLDDFKQANPDYENWSKQERINNFRKLDTHEGFDVAVLSDDQKSMLDVATRRVVFSENDALKQVISRDGNTGFDASSYQHVQYLLDNATLVVREYDKKRDEYRQQTTWVEGHNEDGKRYLAILHQTKDNKNLYLKSYRLDRSRDEKLKKKGVVLFEK